MAKKKQPANYMEQLSQHTFGSDEPDPGEKAHKEPTVAELQAQIAALTERINAPPPVQPGDFPTVTLPTPPGEVDLKGLPDPMEDKDGYAKALNDRIQANIIARQEYEAAMAEAEEQQYAIVNGRVDGLWQDFQRSNPELAKFPNRIRHMAQDVVEAASQRGINVQEYMFKQPQRFFADVVNAYKAEYGEPEKEDDGLPEGRTEGVGGGDFMKGSPETEAEAKKYDFVKELKTTQATSGFF